MNGSEYMDKFKAFRERWKNHSEEERKIHEEFHKQHHEFHRMQYDMQKRYREFYTHRAEFRCYHRNIRYMRPVALIFNFFIWYLLYINGGLKVLSIIFAALISIGVVFQLMFLRRIEQRILKPVDSLRKGVEEIANGNYDVRVDENVTNEIGMLIYAFNDMVQKLKESEKLKAEYEENRKTLIANISHDLKTPITSIQGYIEAILDENAVSPENINKYLKIIYSSTAYMNKLIDDLFLFSKLDMEKLEFQFERVHVSAFISDLMEEFKFDLEEKKVKFNYTDSLKSDYIFNVDRKRLHQVFMNVIGNAVKYGPEQGLAIESVLYFEDSFACIDINDNGPGIPADKLPYIFNRFYRIDTERTKDFTSTGLGLAIAKELVEVHGGKITVSSEENRGTCFTIKLPILS